MTFWQTQHSPMNQELSQVLQKMAFLLNRRYRTDALLILGKSGSILQWRIQALSRDSRTLRTSERVADVSVVALILIFTPWMGDLCWRPVKARQNRICAPPSCRQLAYASSGCARCFHRPSQSALPRTVFVLCLKFDKFLKKIHHRPVLAKRPCA